MAGESAVRSTVGTVGPVHWDRLGAPEWLIPGARADPKVECILDIEKESLGYGYWGGGVDTVAGANGSSAVDCRMSTQIQFDYQNDISKGKGQPIQNKSCFKAN
jgi:hypothetical protein